MSPTEPRERPTAQTRERLLDSAERHFSEHGFAGASLREITNDAEANLAAVSYHFGSKEELFVAVLERVMAPINRERLELLDAAEERAAGRPLELEELLTILVGPVLRSHAAAGGAGCSLRLFARGQFEDASMWKRIAEGPLKVIKPRLEAALARSLPHLSAQEIAYRMHFMMGAVKSAAGDQHALRAMSRGLCDPDDIEGTLTQLVAFLAAGMRAPSAAAAPAARRAARRPASKERSK
jgi:AcrR family transcriptional regulator